MYDAEIKIVKEILNRSQKYFPDSIEDFFRLVHCNKTSNSIVFTPSGKSIAKFEFSPDLSKKMLNCVKNFHHMGIVHRDLTPHHFLIRIQNDQEKVSFSSSVFLLFRLFLFQ